MDAYVGTRQEATAETVDPRDRRLSPRYPVKGSVHLIENGVPREFGLVRDISLEGCFISSPAEIPERAPVRLRFSIGADFEMDGIVRRIDAGRGLAVQFLPPDAPPN